MSPVRRLAIAKWPLAWIIEALKEGLAPSDVQKRAAELLASSIGENGEGKRITIRPKGRPKKTMRSLANVQLVDAIDYIAEEYAKQGSGKPYIDAKIEVAEIHEKKPLETIKRYYREGVKERAELEAKIAVWIDECSEIEFRSLQFKQFDKDVTELKKQAFRQAVVFATKQFFGTVFVIEHVYKRGKRAVLNRSKVKPEK